MNQHKILTVAFFALTLVVGYASGVMGAYSSIGQQAAVATLKVVPANVKKVQVDALQAREAQMSSNGAMPVSAQAAQDIQAAQAQNAQNPRECVRKAINLALENALNKCVRNPEDNTKPAPPVKEPVKKTNTTPTSDQTQVQTTVSTDSNTVTN